MLYSIGELRQEVFQKVFDVYDIFKDFFDEKFVDLQDIPGDDDIKEVFQTYDVEESEYEDSYEISEFQLSSIKGYYSSLQPIIYVWWPNVIVTNENDRSVHIQDLYAKVKVTMDGQIPVEFHGFQLTRSTFSELQFTSGYIHSHVPRRNGLPRFSDPCLGTGPIKNTILDLKSNYEEALWMLFCQELSLYVTVESLAGGPYFRMESIVTSSKFYNYSDYNLNLCTNLNTNNFSFLRGKAEEYINTFKLIIKDFTLWYLKKGRLSFNFKNGSYVPGMPFFDYMIDISNCFIDYFNHHEITWENVEFLYNHELLIKASVSNGQFYRYIDADIPRDFELEGEHILFFKGRDIKLRIDRSAEERREPVTLLGVSLAMFILRNILKIINYRYTNNGKRIEHTSGETSITSTYQTVCYI